MSSKRSRSLTAIFLLLGAKVAFSAAAWYAYARKRGTDQKPSSLAVTEDMVTEFAGRTGLDKTQARAVIERAVRIYLKKGESNGHGKGTGREEAPGA